MKKRTKILIWLVLIAVVVIGGLLIWNSLRSGASEKGANMPDINLRYTVERKTIGDSLEVIGNVTAPERNIYGRVSGELEKLLVEENGRVEKGATVARISDNEYQLQYLQAKTAYENSIGTAPKIVEEKQKALEIAGENLENTVLRAPVSGFVKAVNYKVGDLITANAVICTLVEDGEMKVEASVDEVDLKKVEEGQRVQFTFEPLDNLRLNGKIRDISLHANSSGGIVVIPIEFSFNKDPREYGVIPGLSCNVKIVLMERADVISIPLLALKEDEGGTFVYILPPSAESNKNESKSGDDREKRYIKTGQKTEKYVEVTEGLEAGETVIIPPDQARAIQAMEDLNLSFTGGPPTGGGRNRP